jgi:hypothetical protein
MEEGRRDEGDDHVMFFFQKKQEAKVPEGVFAGVELVKERSRKSQFK